MYCMIEWSTTVLYGISVALSFVFVNVKCKNKLFKTFTALVQLTNAFFWGWDTAWQHALALRRDFFYMGNRQQVSR